MTKYRWWCAGLIAASLGFAYEPTAVEKVLVDNEFVRATDVRVPPGVFEPKHSHARGVTISLSDYSNEAKSFPDGIVHQNKVKFGEVHWAEPVTHEARNTGSTEQRVIRIELKKDAPASSAAPPSELNPLLVCKDTLKTIVDNQFVLVVDDRIPPGVAEAKHQHRHGLAIELADADLEMTTYPDHKTARRHETLGEVDWTEPTIHAVRNVGTAPTHTIRIELK